MTPRHLLALCLAVALPLAASGSEGIEATKKAAAVANQGEANHACLIAEDDEVANWFGDTKPHKREDSQLSQGIAGCRWETPKNVLTTQTFKARRSAAEEARARATRLAGAAAAKFRYEPFTGMGDEATMVVERGGAAGDIVMIVVHNGDNMAVITAKSLINGDRDETRKAFKDLGRKASGRI
jgi:hypothetical protein